jgi:peptide deformylase
MSEILKLNTVDPKYQQQEKEVEPFPLFDENHPMMKQRIPEYDITLLPNPVMTHTINRLKMTMKLYNGLGLSANQCGVFERVSIVGNGEIVIVCINPKVIKASDDLIKDNEGCLSFPGLFLKVERASSVEVEYYDFQGKKYNTTFTGLTARCFLHELDHMNGITMDKHVKPLALKMAKEKQGKLFKRVKRLQRNNGIFV